jgi:hypothetical protein
MGRAALAAVALAFVLGGAAGAAEYQIKSIRWEEDYSYLAASPRPLEGLEQIKFIPLTDDKSSWLTLGGEIRLRSDDIQNAAFSLRPGGDYITTTTRLLFLTDWHLGSTARVFIQLGYHDEAGRKPASRSFDEGLLDLQQGFADWSITGTTRIRIGRQELPLGNQRLSEVREGGNIRRSFDGVRIDAAIASANVIAFWAQPVLDHQGYFDDRPVAGDAFYGVYAVIPFPVLVSDIDLYCLTREKAASTFAIGTAQETRSTLGARIDGTNAAWDWDGQLLGQWGSFGSEDIRAYAATLETGWTARSWSWQPRLSLRADIGSGDARKGDGELGTFDAPFPNFTYLSATSAYWPGNAWSLFPLLTATPTHATTFYLGAQYMGRLSTGDAFYYQPQSPIALPGTDAHGVMTQVYSRLKWQPDQHWSLSATVIYQAAGTATNAAGGEDVFISSANAAWRF